MIQKEPTLEMRLAAIEDKLARLTVTDEEMAAYSKGRGSRGRPWQRAIRAEGERCPRRLDLDSELLDLQHCYIHPISERLHPVPTKPGKVAEWDSPASGVVDAVLRCLATAR